MESPRYTITRPSPQKRLVPPKQLSWVDEGTCFLDFGKAAFGTVLLPAGDGTVMVHLGEKSTREGRVERNPAGCIRYQAFEVTLNPNGPIRLVIPPDERNTGPAAIRMPEEIGEVFPFRFVEIEGAKELDLEAVFQIAVHVPFDEEASAFSSSDETLDAVWDLCKHSIKATSFCGVYVDGDRERIPYEGDAYINQLCHYGVDREYAMARYSHEYLIQHPTWPTEWQLHSVMMAWADVLYTGEAKSVEVFYDDLCAKTLIGLAREDGLISTESELCTKEFEETLHLHGDGYIFERGLGDLVDWPPGSFTEGGTGERDNHEMAPINTVVNAFHAHALSLMAKIAGVLGKTEDQTSFAQQAERVTLTINDLLFDEARGIYIDGEGSAHASLHSNMFMLAFELVPEERKASVIDFVKSRGMACSVYGAQYLLEALFLNGEAEAALDLITAQNDRSWWNMLQQDATITWEAWDLKYKNNLDWNHAWGAAPANILPRYVLGVRPLEPGCTKILIAPQPGNLKEVKGKVPIPQGSVSVSITVAESGERVLEIEIPSGVEAVVEFDGDHHLRTQPMG